MLFLGQDWPEVDPYATGWGAWTQRKSLLWFWQTLSGHPHDQSVTYPWSLPLSFCFPGTNKCYCYIVLQMEYHEMEVCGDSYILFKNIWIWLDLGCLWARSTHAFCACLLLGKGWGLHCHWKEAAVHSSPCEGQTLHLDPEVPGSRSKMAVLAQGTPQSQERACQNNSAHQNSGGSKWHNQCQLLAQS